MPFGMPEPDVGRHYLALGGFTAPILIDYCNGWKRCFGQFRRDPDVVFFADVVGALVPLSISWIAAFIYALFSHWLVTRRTIHTGTIKEKLSYAYAY